ncbi:hypothetical protein QBC38DRAFT_447477 [Podospora fimiseda]|uniref:Uncharacterized protein n=1 Tax=Podospora fimiseda TaxID=252190 RepID=A0AAN7BHC5_9PEZI|nr:hypothetical protein QBC38DRAFT_447477 [Podospora fimiseda]
MAFFDSSLSGFSQFICEATHKLIKVFANPTSAQPASSRGFSSSLPTITIESISPSTNSGAPSPSASSTEPPDGRLSQSDKIALGVGVPGTVMALGTIFWWLRKRMARPGASSRSISSAVDDGASNNRITNNNNTDGEPRKGRYCKQAIRKKPPQHVIPKAIIVLPKMISYYTFRPALPNINVDQPPHLGGSPGRDGSPEITDTS